MRYLSEIDERRRATTEILRTFSAPLRSDLFRTVGAQMARSTCSSYSRDNSLVALRPNLKVAK